MRGLQHIMPAGLLRTLHERRLFLGVAPPQNKHDRFCLFRHQPDNRIDELLPAFADFGQPRRAAE